MKLNRTLAIVIALAGIAVIGVVFASGFGGSDADIVETQATPEGAATVTTTRSIQSTTSAQATGAITGTRASAASVPVAKPGPLLLLNPAVGAAGSAVSVAGSGFDPGATVNVTFKRADNDKGQDLGFAQADQGGSFGGINFNIPDGTSGTFIVLAQQDKSDKQAKATGQVQGASPSVKFGTQVGKPGDRIAISAKGFAAGENVNIYFNSIGSQPVATLPADAGGSLGRASVTVPYGPSGNNSFILMGEKSQSPVTVQFLMLNFYPAAGLSTYAAKPDTAISFSATGFGPNERVTIFLNSPQAAPASSVETNAEGSFTNAGEFVVPFNLNGKNTFIFIGEKSQAAVTAGFDVLPYTPYAEASTYGARPGTTLTFYGRDFARDEVVRVYVGRGQGSAGSEVSCFKTDNRGAIGAGGGYTIPHDAQAGKTTFVLVGDKSKAEAPVVFQIMDAGGPVPASPDEAKEFRCPYDNDQSAAPAAPAAPSGGQPAPAAAPASATTTAGQSKPQTQTAASTTATPKTTTTSATKTTTTSQSGR